MRICSCCLQVCAKVGNNVIVKFFGDGHKVSSQLWNFLVMEDVQFLHGLVMATEFLGDGRHKVFS
jgi:hypothetical protein